MTITNLKEEHQLTSDEKLQTWGYGEWVEEPDQFSFDYGGLTCEGQRTFNPETLRLCIENDLLKYFPIFGGHWCGYVIIPESHDFYKKDMIDLVDDCDVHGGITYSQFDQGVYKIGFDCAHSGDLVPSSQKSFRQQSVSKLFSRNNIYRNQKFVMGQCIQLVRICQEITRKSEH